MPSHMCLWLGLLLLVTLASSQKEKEIRSLMHDTDVNYREPSIDAGVYNSNDDDDFEVEFIYAKKDSSVPLGASESSTPIMAVKRLWGVPDTQTFVGRVFSYPIPSDAFEGDILTYQLSDLPSWLSFSDRKRLLEGVPAASDVGAHYISIRVEGKDGSTAKDAFAIQVSHLQAADRLKETKCSAKDDVTIMSVVIDSPLTSIRPRDRVQLLHRIASLFMTKVSRISLSEAPENFDPFSDDSTVLAGAGSTKSQSGNLRPKTESNSVQGFSQIQWAIGCNGEISKEHRLQVENVESSAANGKLQRLIGFPVIGWHVSQMDPSSIKRIRRDATIEEYSGDDYPDNDYEYDYDDYFKKLHNAYDKPSSGSTPVVGDTPLSVIDEPTTSPVFKLVPLSTPAYVPVKPTRVVVDASPTGVLKTEYPFGKSDSDLESSLLVHPATSADYTTPLTGATSPPFEGEPTRPSGPIEASAVPDPSVTTEYAVKNFPPRVANRIQKLAWIAGNVYRMRIPKDTFYDTEDGDTRNLSLILKDERGLVFPRDSWIQFDPSKQEVYALPLERDIGNYDFRLEAIDKDRKSIKDFFTVSVRQHSQARNFHHEFTAVMKLEKKYAYDFAFSLDWQVRAVEKIAALFKDSISSINVRNITSDPVHLTWTNVTLIDSSSTMCPTDQLEAVSEVMRSGHNSEPTRNAVNVFRPEFQLKRINARFFDPCEPHFGHKETSGVEGSSTFEMVEETKANSVPIIRNPIDHLTAIVGTLFRFQVPYIMCYDMEDGYARNLKMQLLTTDQTPPPADSWLQFDSANQEFFGLPLYDDAGRKEYILKCMDSKQATVSDALIVEVKRRPTSASSNSPVHFVLTVDANMEDLMLNAHEKVKLIDRIGIAFGDANASHVVVDSLREGSVIIEWHNGSLPNDPCPHEEVQRLRNIMTDSNGQLRKKFTKTFLPEFRISDGEIIPSGSCLVGDTPTHIEELDVGNPNEEEVLPTDEDYLLTFIVPAVIIAVMLLLAALIACCLYRRRRYGKMSMTDERTFVSKGIPIIFAEELDDQRGPENAKSPVIMKEEKPPLPPPPHASDDAPYQPPPPFSSNGSHRNQRPNLPPAYRKPPTYVPP